ncbi:uncharacterized protein LOC129922812 isoform X2 [Biomphalaria glabrata]|uniref:Uncharacterized protein LOC129922812 isoform X2 n=1 Tax=Biomphalaria glabrata TaxID=6526 RepID=A0A9W2YU12_BIOGL|nr:uncharacterized protein LOC129922812 isoform X2 [Biomphalaria glabrata]
MIDDLASACDQTDTMDNFKACWHFKSVLWMLASCLIVTAYADLDACSHGCKCTDHTATCTSLTNKFTSRFPDHIKKIIIEKSTLESLESLLLGKETKLIVIRDSEITRLETYFLRDISAPITLEFSKVLIMVIAANAFHNVRLKKINFDYVNIETIESHAFSNVFVHDLILTDCDVTEVKSASFHSVHVMDLLKLNSTVLRKIEKESFKNILGISRLDIEQSKFMAMECHALVPLMEASAKVNGSFFLTTSSLECDCSTVSLLQYIHRHPDSVSDSVTCFVQTTDGSSLNVGVKKMTDLTKLCQHKSTRPCHEDYARETPRVLVTTTSEAEAPNTGAVSISFPPENIATSVTQVALDKNETNTIVTTTTSACGYVAATSVATSLEQADLTDTHSAAPQTNALENIASRNTFQNLPVLISLMTLFTCWKI